MTDDLPLVRFTFGVNFMNEFEEQKAAQPAMRAGALSLTGENAPRSLSAGSVANWAVQLKSGDASKQIIILRIIANIEPGAPEWDVKLADTTGVLYDSASLKEPVAKIAMEGSKPKELKVMAEAPRGARFDDIVKITLEACPRAGLCLRPHGVLRRRHAVHHGAEDLHRS